VGLRVLQHTTRAACASLPTSIVPPLAVSVSATSAFHCCGPRLADDAPPSSSTTSFGFREVEVEEKQGLVREVFKNVASSYDVMNDVMSAGLHRVWKDQLVAMLRPAPGCRHLDVAGGTGDVAFRVVDAIRRAERSALIPCSQQAHVTVCDINPHMLEVGQERAKKLGLDEKRISWVEGNAERLPFEDESMDSYTIAFGLRNCTHIDAVLRDAYRVLKPGGRFLCMEFNTVHNPVLRKAYDAYSFTVIPAMGQLVAGDRDSYQYLVESIRKFPRQDTLAAMMEDAQFAHVGYEDILDGVVSIHSGFKYQ